MSEVLSARRSERRSAIRRLLVSPLFLARRDPEEFDRLCRHADWLIRWFDEVAGWRLSVEPAAGFARLYKVRVPRAGARSARTRIGAPFDRRRYVLLALALSALSDLAGQTTVRQLADLVKEASQGSPGLDAFDADRGSERRAFVDALLCLADEGVLLARDGDAEGYVSGDPEGDVLYDVNDRLLAHLCGVVENAYPDTEEGRKTRAKHEVVRILLDEPVLYFRDLSSEARDWFHHGSGWLYDMLREDVGLSIERRLEGLAAVDPAGELSDESFPDGGSTVRHASLLLAEQFADPARRGRVVGTEEVVRLTGLLMQSFAERSAWSRLYPRDATGAAQLSTDALELLCKFGLVERMEGGWSARPAIARFRPLAPGEGTSKENES